MGEVYNGDLDPNDLPNDNESPLPFKEFDKSISENLSSLFEQTNQELEPSFDEIISEPEDVIQYWEDELKLVERELPALFIPGTLELKNEEETIDIDFHY